MILESKMDDSFPSSQFSFEELVLPPVDLIGIEMEIKLSILCVTIFRMCYDICFLNKNSQENAFDRIGFMKEK